MSKMEWNCNTFWENKNKNVGNGEGEGVDVWEWRSYPVEK